MVSIYTSARNRTWGFVNFTLGGLFLLAASSSAQDLGARVFELVGALGVAWLGARVFFSSWIKVSGDEIEFRARNLRKVRIPISDVERIAERTRVLVYRRVYPCIVLKTGREFLLTPFEESTAGRRITSGPVSTVTELLNHAVDSTGAL